MRDSPLNTYSVALITQKYNELVGELLALNPELDYVIKTYFHEEEEIAAKLRDDVQKLKERIIAKNSREYF